MRSAQLGLQQDNSAEDPDRWKHTVNTLDRIIGLTSQKAITHLTQCHAEQSEASRISAVETLRSAQGITFGRVR